MFGLSQDNNDFSQHPRWIVRQIGADKPPAYAFSLIGVALQ